MSTYKKKIYLSVLIFLGSLFIFLLVVIYNERNLLPQKFNIQNANILNINTLNKIVDINEINKQHPEKLSLLEIKKIFLGIPYIERCDLFISYDGKLIINLYPRKILARINNIYKEQFLLDYNNTIIPLPKTAYIYNIPEIKGVKEKYKYLKKITDIKILQISSILQKINSGKFSQKQILTINVDLNKDISLILYNRLENEKYNFIIGDDSSIEKKIRNMHIFFNEIKPKFKTKNYSSINLKYNNQIICYK